MIAIGTYNAINIIANPIIFAPKRGSKKENF
jgi:hypothetical protein